MNIYQIYYYADGEELTINYFAKKEDAETALKEQEKAYPSLRFHTRTIEVKE